MSLQYNGNPSEEVFCEPVELFYGNVIEIIGKEAGAVITCTALKVEKNRL